MERSEGDAIDLSGDWREAKYKDLIIDAVGEDDWFELPKDAKLEKTKELGIEVDPALEDFEVTNDVFEKIIEHTLIQPTFVTHIPRELCPLAKITETDNSTIDVFELCINGQEIAPAYSEQNDPAVQREAFMKQVGEETQELDDDFLLALEHGMPPAGGMGLGIDRLVIFLTKAANIRDTILFPTLRPSDQASWCRVPGDEDNEGHSQRRPANRYKSSLVETGSPYFISFYLWFLLRLY